MNQNQPQILQIQSINAYYGKNHVLKNISFNAERGTITAILGANGAGKSTLLKIIAGLANSQLTYTGKILLQNQDIRFLTQTEAAKKRAYIAQNENPAQHYTVSQNVLMGRFAHSKWNYTKNDEHIAAQKTALLDLENLAQRDVTQLSGGEFKRVLIARSLTQESSVLLFDEPCTGLDVKYQYQLLNLIRDLAQKHKLCALLSLHDINTASLFADSIALLKNGSLIAHGNSQNVIESGILKTAFDIDFTVFLHPQTKKTLVFI